MLLNIWSVIRSGHYAVPNKKSDSGGAVGTVLSFRCSQRLRLQYPLVPCRQRLYGPRLFHSTELKVFDQLRGCLCDGGNGGGATVPAPSLPLQRRPSPLPPLLVDGVRCFSPETTGGSTTLSNETIDHGFHPRQTHLLVARVTQSVV